MLRSSKGGNKKTDVKACGWAIMGINCPSLRAWDFGFCGLGFRVWGFLFSVRGLKFLG